MLPSRFLHLTEVGAGTGFCVNGIFYQYGWRVRCLYMVALNYTSKCNLQLYQTLINANRIEQKILEFVSSLLRNSLQIGRLLPKRLLMLCALNIYCRHGHYGKAKVFYGVKTLFGGEILLLCHNNRSNLSKNVSRETFFAHF